MIELEGEHTTAHVLGLSGGDIESTTLDQIQEMIDHEAFTNPVRIQPDTHPGAGSVIGFTMPLGEKIVPNVVGVDIGCGLHAIKLALDPDADIDHTHLDAAVRDRVPMGAFEAGLKAPNRDYYHVKDDFPWNLVNNRLDTVIDATEDTAYSSTLKAFRDDGGYNIQYFKRLVTERAGTMSSYFNQKTAINSVGTLGGGNHFIELAESATTGEYWVIVHSGSRGLGEKTAQYWQHEANEACNDPEERLARIADGVRETLRGLPDGHLDYTKFDVDNVSDADLLTWMQGGHGESFVDYNALNADFKDTDPERIEAIGNDLKTAIPDESYSVTDPEVHGDPLDYLEGDAAAGYLIDMLFCQQYAVESREMMANTVAEELDTHAVDEIQSIHNFIDFRDQIIRKGATRAYDGERAVIPFNMQAGTLIVEGTGNPNWNYSAPHGAGRVKSRTQAEDDHSEDEVRSQMESVDAYATEFPPEEAPGSYKDPALIEDAISDTATIVDRLTPVHNWKAP